MASWMNSCEYGATLACAGGQGVAGSNPVVPTVCRARWLWVKVQVGGFFCVLLWILVVSPLWSKSRSTRVRRRKSGDDHETVLTKAVRGRLNGLSLSGCGQR